RHWTCPSARNPMPACAPSRHRLATPPEEQAMEPLKSGIAALLALGLMATPAQAAHSPAEHAAHMATQTADPHAGHQGHAGAQSGAQVAFADVPLLDQEGRELRLKDDLVGDRIVVMGFVYTSCTTVCPVISAILQKLQKQLGERA